jgi:hypothetical protein
MLDDARAFLERWADDNIIPNTSKSRDAYIDALVAKCYRDAEEGGLEAPDIDEAAAEATDGEDLPYFIETALERADLVDMYEEDVE